MPAATLMSVPNVSEGRAAGTVAAIGAAFTADGLQLLDVHSDADHHRSVFTLAGSQRELAEGLFAGARATVAAVNVTTGAAVGRPGQHPHVGALDVLPVVYLDERCRGAACATALLIAERIGSELGVPVFLYGELTSDECTEGRTRAGLRRGGLAGLTQRMSARSETLSADFGPTRPHRSAGVTLVAARPPLLAFNLQLAAPATLQRAREIAALIREGGAEGLPGVRAIGVELHGGVAQVSMNLERPFEITAAVVTEAVRRHAPLAGAELVGLAPAAALEGFPEDVPLPGFDPARHIIENALGC